jgi:branched-chain amino acid transport system permease protein
MLVQILVNGVIKGCMYALVALGFGLIYNTTRILHVAHGAVFTGGAYLLFVFLNKLRMPLGIAVFLAVIGSGMVGFLLEVLVYRPLERKRASKDVALMSSLGIYIALVNLLALLFGSESKVVRSSLEKTAKYGPFILSGVQVTQVIAFLIG